MILFHPVIDLDKICHELWPCHELSEPWFAKFLMRFHKEESLGAVDKWSNWSVRVIDDGTKMLDQQFFIARMIGLWIGAFFAVKEFFR